MWSYAKDHIEEIDTRKLTNVGFRRGGSAVEQINNLRILCEKTREARVRWFGHVQRKYDGYIGRRMLRMELPRKWKRRRPKRRFMDAVREDGSG